jgi:hypothetical protein
MRLEVWRQKMQVDVYVKHRAMETALEVQAQAQSQDFGHRQLRQILKRLVKGELGLRVEVWRTAMLDQGRAVKMASLQAECEQMIVDNDALNAMGLLKQIVKRLSKGEASMRLEVWRQQVKIEAYAKHRTIQTELDAKLRTTISKRQSSAVEILKITVWELVRGEAGMRLAVWRVAAKAARILSEKNFFETELHRQQQRLTQARPLPASPSSP